MFWNQRISSGFFAVLSLGAVVGLPALAVTPPVLMLSDGIGDVVTIDSTGIPVFSGNCNTSPANTCSTSFSSGTSSSVTWSGVIGPFGLSTAPIAVNGTSNHSLTSPQLDVNDDEALGFFNQSTNTPATLTIEWSDTGFTGGVGGSATMNGNTNCTTHSPASACIIPSASVTYNSYVDNTNTLNGMGTPVGTLGPFTTGGASGMVSGSGPTASTYSMTEVVTITLGNTSARLYGFDDSLTVTPTALALTCPASTGQVGVPYSSALMATGGIPPYKSFMLLTGSLPTGLSLNSSTGAITGTPSVAGPFPFTAQVTDNAGNMATTPASGCKITIAPAAPPTPVAPGDTATIGFWHNKNGQAVIDSFNGGSSETELGNWLATNFGNLFGAANPYTGTSLAGLTNAQVAQVYLNLWQPSGVTKNTYVQVFAGALACYATDPTLGYNSTAASFGFIPSTGGTCSKVYNIGSNGAALGVPNGTTLSVMTVLTTANNNFNPSTGLFYGGSQTLTSDLNNVINGINSTGDIG